MAGAGTYVLQPSGYRAFIPAPLPPARSVGNQPDIQAIRSEADLALGRLDGAASILPNPDLFVSVYVQQESVLSSQIEGTQASLVDVLQFTVDGAGELELRPVAEVVNHVHAMNYGLE